MNFFTDTYTLLQEWLMQHMILPLLYTLGLMDYADSSIDALDLFCLGLVQVLVIALVIIPLEKRLPVHIYDRSQHETQRLRRARRTDIFYTLIHRLGFFHLIFFALFSNFIFLVDAQLHDVGFNRLNVESWLPGITSIPWVSFLIYLIVLDFGEYVYHRLSHRFHWWWQLHAIHHSQEYMSAWSDNRNHILDDIGHALFFSLLALLIGVEPVQFIALVALSQLIQSWQHANVKLDHAWFKYILISPQFHRFHHAVGMGYEVPGKPGVLGGCNFGVLFPWWDMIFGTAIFSKESHPTGVRGMSGQDSVWMQQYLGLKRSIQSFFSV